MLVQEPLGDYKVFSCSFESSRDHNSAASSDPNPVPPRPVLLVDARDASHLVACSFQWSIPPVVQGGSGESDRSSRKVAPVQPASSASENTPKPRSKLVASDSVRRIDVVVTMQLPPAKEFASQHALAVCRQSRTHPGKNPVAVQGKRSPA